MNGSKQEKGGNNSSTFMSTDFSVDNYNKKL